MVLLWSGSINRLRKEGNGECGGWPLQQIELMDCLTGQEVPTKTLPFSCLCLTANGEVRRSVTAAIKLRVRKRTTKNDQTKTPFDAGPQVFGGLVAP